MINTNFILELISVLLGIGIILSILFFPSIISLFRRHNKVLFIIIGNIIIYLPGFTTNAKLSSKFDGYILNLIFIAYLILIVISFTDDIKVKSKLENTNQNNS